MNHLCVNTNFTCNVSNLCFSNLLFVLRFHNTFSPSFFFGSDFECPLLFKKFSHQPEVLQICSFSGYSYFIMNYFLLTFSLRLFSHLEFISLCWGCV